MPWLLWNINRKPEAVGGGSIRVSSDDLAWPLTRVSRYTLYGIRIRYTLQVEYLILILRDKITLEL